MAGIGQDDQDWSRYCCPRTAPQQKPRGAEEHKAKLVGLEKQVVVQLPHLRVQQLLSVVERELECTCVLSSMFLAKLASSLATLAASPALRLG